MTLPAWCVLQASQVKPVLEVLEAEEGDTLWLRPTGRTAAGHLKADMSLAKSPSRAAAESGEELQQQVQVSQQRQPQQVQQAQLAQSLAQQPIKLPQLTQQLLQQQQAAPPAVAPQQAADVMNGLLPYLALIRSTVGPKAPGVVCTPPGAAAPKRPAPEGSASGSGPPKKQQKADGGRTGSGGSQAASGRALGILPLPRQQSQVVPESPSAAAGSPALEVLAAAAGSSHLATPALPGSPGPDQQRRPSPPPQQQKVKQEQQQWLTGGSDGLPAAGLAAPPAVAGGAAAAALPSQRAVDAVMAVDPGSRLSLVGGVVAILEWAGLPATLEAVRCMYLGWHFARACFLRLGWALHLRGGTN